MYLAWRYGNEDPYRLYNFSNPEVGLTSPYPSRVQAFIYACAVKARNDHIEEIKAAAGAQ